MTRLRLGKRISVGGVELISLERVTIVTFGGHFVQVDWAPFGVLVYEERTFRALDLNGDVLPDGEWRDLVNDSVMSRL